MELANTGLIRRVDDLGRVVIPKELRQVLFIQDGDPLEIYLTNDRSGVVFRRHDVIPVNDQFLRLAKTLGDLGDWKYEGKVRELLREYKSEVSG